MGQPPLAYRWISRSEAHAWDSPPGAYAWDSPHWLIGGSAGQELMLGTACQELMPGIASHGLSYMGQPVRNSSWDSLERFFLSGFDPDDD